MAKAKRRYDLLSDPLSMVLGRVSPTITYPRYVKRVVRVTIRSGEGLVARAARALGLLGGRRRRWRRR